MASTPIRNKPALYKPTDFNSQHKKSQMKEEEEENKKSTDHPNGFGKEENKIENDGPQKKVTILKPPQHLKDTKTESGKAEDKKLSEKPARVSDKDLKKIKKLREFMEKQQLEKAANNSDQGKVVKEIPKKEASTSKQRSDKSQKPSKGPLKGKARCNEKAPKKNADSITKQGAQDPAQRKQLNDKQTASGTDKLKEVGLNTDYVKHKRQQQNQKVNEQSPKKSNQCANFCVSSNDTGNHKIPSASNNAESILGNPYLHNVGSRSASKQHQHRLQHGPSKRQPGHLTGHHTIQNSFGPGPSLSSTLKTNNPHITVPATKDKNEHKRSLDFVKKFFDNDPEVQYYRKKNAEKSTPVTDSQPATDSSISNVVTSNYISTDSELASYLNHGTQNPGSILHHNMSMSMASNYSNLYNMSTQNQIQMGASNNTFSHAGATGSPNQQQQHHRSSPGSFHTISHGSLPQHIQRNFEMYSSPNQSIHAPTQQGHFPIRSHAPAHANVRVNNMNLLTSYSNYFPHGSPQSHIFRVNQEVDQDISSMLKNSNKPGKWQQKALSKCGPIDSNQARSLIEQLIDGTYECMVCCEFIKFNSAVWNCSNCFHIFHLTCIRKWAKSEAASVKNQNGWRCPGCQNVSTRPPNKYFCFCGKVRDPDWTPRDGITPHSCGETCGKTRLNPPCEHSCKELCHPGPCPPCPVMVTKSCFCGQSSTKVRCGLLRTMACVKDCSKPLACGKHLCSLKCHEGPCQKCDVHVLEECFCCKDKRVVFCGSKEVVVDSEVESVEDAVQNGFSCEQVCDGILACGNHRCNDICHLDTCKDCPLLPEYVKYCPCEKVEVSVLLNLEKRVTCLDTIPTCNNFCGKKFLCGNKGASHVCMTKCHAGSCKPCGKTTDLWCRCGFKKKEIKCKDLVPEDVLLCDRKCNKKRRCGRHKCNQKCCVDKEHDCNVSCGKKLSCGQHRCEKVCHTGFCPQCWRAGFDELSCRCGATVLYPPIACGTKAPECDRLCARQHQCGHPPQHPCHNEEQCPPCTILTTRNCMGGHQLWKSVPCHLREVSCGQNCEKPLRCGTHQCKKQCHKGTCLSEEEVCLQPCNKPRLDCDHPCNAPCHVGLNCPRAICKVQVTLTCRCGRKTASVMCNAGNINSTYQSFNTEMLSMQLKNLQSGQTVNISDLANPEKRPKFLECDEVCSLEERNKKLAEALDIHRGEKDHFEVNIFSSFLKQEARLRMSFIQNVEEVFENVVVTAKKSLQPVRHSFPSMNKTQRKMIHELSERYGFKTYSVDCEPKRSTVVIATRDSFMPQLKLSDLLEKELENEFLTTGKQHFKRTNTLKSILKQSANEHTEKKVNYYDDDDIEK